MVYRMFVSLPSFSFNLMSMLIVFSLLRLLIYVIDFIVLASPPCLLCYCIVFSFLVFSSLICCYHIMYVCCLLATFILYEFDCLCSLFIA